MRTIDEIKADIEYYTERQKHVVKNQDFTVPIKIAENELRQAYIKEIPLDRLAAIYNAERDGRLVVLEKGLEKTNFAYITSSPLLLSRKINLMYMCDIDWQKAFLEWMKEPRAEAEAALKEKEEQQEPKKYSGMREHPETAGEFFYSNPADNR